MIEITDRVTSITAGMDPVGVPYPHDAGDSRVQRQHAPTGARVTLEFSRAEALPPGQPVRVRYEFGDDGAVREAVGIAVPTQSRVRWGCAVVYHYRLSHWIAPGELKSTVASYVRQRTEAVRMPRFDSVQPASVAE
jgi:hypothetical protein